MCWCTVFDANNQVQFFEHFPLLPSHSKMIFLNNQPTNQLPPIIYNNTIIFIIIISTSLNIDNETTQTNTLESKCKPKQNKQNTSPNTNPRTQYTIRPKPDAKTAAADNDDGNNTNNDASQSPTKDNDGDNGSQGRQTAVLVESDGHITKNGHRVVIQHSRSPSTTSHRLADVWELFASPLNIKVKWN